MRTNLRKKEKRFETLFKSIKNSKTNPDDISRNLEIFVDEDSKSMGPFTKFAISVLTIMVIASFLT
jgi:hypothetical protein